MRRRLVRGPPLQGKNRSLVSPVSVSVSVSVSVLVSVYLGYWVEMIVSCRGLGMRCRMTMVGVGCYCRYCCCLCYCCCGCSYRYFRASAISVRARMWKSSLVSRRVLTRSCVTGDEGMRRLAGVEHLVRVSRKDGLSQLRLLRTAYTVLQGGGGKYPPHTSWSTVSERADT